MAIVLTLLVLGALLVVVDIVFIPGMIVGIAGAVFMAAGVLTAYNTLSPLAGHLSLAASAIAMAVALFFMFKTDVWSKFALNDTLSGRVNDHLRKSPPIGSFGRAFSDLRPGGKAIFEGETHEVSTRGEYCEAGSEIRVTRIENRKIIVEPVKSADNGFRGVENNQIPVN